MNRGIAPLSLLILIAASLFPACKSSGRDTPGADAGAATDAAAPDSGTPTFTLHYRRPSGDYAGYSLVAERGASLNTIAAGPQDGFGLVFDVPLGPGATRLELTLMASSGPAREFSFDLAETPGRSAWVFEGLEEVFTEAPPSIPGPNQVAIYYLRGDQDYTGWGLHLWGDVAQETQWRAPATARGVDPRFEAHWLVDTRAGASSLWAGTACVSPCSRRRKM